MNKPIQIFPQSGFGIVHLDSYRNSFSGQEPVRGISLFAFRVLKVRQISALL